MLAGFIKGIVVGTLSFILGFAVLSVVLPVAEPVESPSPATGGPPPSDATPVPEAGDPTPSADVPADAERAELADADRGVASPSAPEAFPPRDETPPADQPQPSAAEMPETQPAQPPAEGAEAGGAATPAPVPPEAPTPAPADQPAAAETPDPAPAPVPDPAPAEGPEPPVATIPAATGDVPEPDEAPAPADAATPDEQAPDTPPAPADPRAVPAAAAPEVAPAPAPVPDPARPEQVPDDPAPVMPAPQTPAPTPAPQTPAPPADETSDAAAPFAPAELPRVQAMPSGTQAVAVRRGTEDAPEQPGAARVVAGVTVGRLPSIGTAPEGAPTDEVAAAEDPGDLALPAFLRNAAMIDVAPGTPRMGVVLTDAPGAERALAGLPFSVTVAVDPYAEGAPARAEAYRAAGHEVVVLATDIPELATPSDLRVILDAWMRDFPRVVGLMDAASGGLAENRALAREVAQMLVPEGYGVIARRSGFDGFLQAARNAGLAAAGIYRTLDDEGQSAVTIRRLIDRAAFEAERQPGILITGSGGNADTLGALLGFATDGRSAVQLVPASAVLGAE
ncbi:MAG: hypothetical protein Kow0013_21060 [Pararhodobacter sp.]